MYKSVIKATETEKSVFSRLDPCSANSKFSGFSSSTQLNSANSLLPLERSRQPTVHVAKTSHCDRHPTLTPGKIIAISFISK